ncbi:hypothetical protein NOVO_00865 [Rickettsiales bacterium Ac37b]|nr:hypothetical protein NOVO_00865 [Rickettsiales bacterium Ac37b]
MKDYIIELSKAVFSLRGARGEWKAMNDGYYTKALFAGSIEVSKYCNFASLGEGELLDETKQHLLKLIKIIPSLDIYGVVQEEYENSVKKYLIGKVSHEDYKNIAYPIIEYLSNKNITDFSSIIEPVNTACQYISSKLNQVAKNAITSLRDATNLPLHICEHIVSFASNISNSDVKSLNDALSHNRINIDHYQDRSEKKYLDRYLQGNITKQNLQEFKR